MANTEAPKGGAKKVLNVILNVIIWVFVVFAVCMTVLAFAAQANANGIPAIFGRAFLSVQTDSMEPTIMAGDEIIGETLTLEDAAKLKVDDVITYTADLDGNGIDEFNTHRIIKVNEDVSGVYYTTKGDNEAAEDPFSIYPENVVCKWSGAKLNGVGKFMDFLQTSKGFLVVIVIPLLLFFIYELIKFIKTLVGIKNEGKKQITEADEELIKLRAIEEYKAQMKAEEEKNSGVESTDGEAMILEEPVAEEPVAEETPVEEPVAEEPVAEEPAADEPAAEEVPVEEPVAEETPASDEDSNQ